MSLESDLFSRFRPDFSKFPAAGFTEENGVWRLERPIMDGEFRVEFSVSSSGDVAGRVFDSETGDEYLAVNISSLSGAFVAAVRSEYLKFIEEIAATCFTAQPFKGAQANRICSTVAEKYGTMPEFPWADDDSAVFRDARTRKWFALIMEIAREKIQPGEKGTVEVVNVKAGAAVVPALIAQPGIYRCYHMNKKMWVTLALDDTLPDDQVMALIGTSRAFAATGPSKYAQAVSEGDWLVPCNPHRFDLYKIFAREPTQIWTQTARGIQPGDTVYIYAGAPYSAICFRFKVVETNLLAEDGESPGLRRCMKITALQAYPRNLFPLSKLRAFGVSGVRSARRMPIALKAEITRLAPPKRPRADFHASF